MADGTHEKSHEEKDELNLRIQRFLDWCKENKLLVSEKVKVCLQGSCHRYGMIATQDIEANECLFTIPRKILLEPKTSSIADIISDTELAAKSRKGSGWVPLLLALMFEYTNPKSFWRPYLDIVPQINELDQPMFWSEKDRKLLLQSTEISEDVEEDLENIEKEYNKIVPKFMKKHKKVFNLTTHSLDLYKHMASFVMAYSFTETGNNSKNAPVMVPMADILNHHSNNNAHLEFNESELKMVSTQPIAKGEEVFNTYGQLANCHLLQSYGFVEKTPNPNDSIDISVAMFYKVLQKHVKSKHEARLIDAKFQFMEEMGIVDSNDSFAFDLNGCQSGTNFRLFMQAVYIEQVLPASRAKIHCVYALVTTEQRITSWPRRDNSPHLLHLSESELLLILNNEENNLPQELNDLVSHFTLCPEDQRLESFKTLASALKQRKRSIDTHNDETNSCSPHKQSCHGLCKNDILITSDGEDTENCCGGSVDDCCESNDDASDEWTTDEDSDEEDNQFIEENINESKEGTTPFEEAEADPVTYDQMNDFPKTWKKTLSSIAKDCSVQIDAILKDKNIDKDSDLSSRELSIRHILCGLRDILTLLVKLEASPS